MTTIAAPTVEQTAPPPIRTTATVRVYDHHIEVRQEGHDPVTHQAQAGSLETGRNVLYRVLFLALAGQAPEIGDWRQMVLETLMGETFVVRAEQLDCLSLYGVPLIDDPLQGRRATHVLDFHEAGGKGWIVVPHIHAGSDIEMKLASGTMTLRVGPMFYPLFAAPMNALQALWVRLQHARIASLIQAAEYTILAADLIEAQSRLGELGPGEDILPGPVGDQVQCLVCGSENIGAIERMTGIAYLAYDQGAKRWRHTGRVQPLDDGRVPVCTPAGLVVLMCADCAAVWTTSIAVE